ncbi:hypothetical protein J5N58_05265 [Rhizobium cremeum]|uniref:hypothetical protein n=1 Tax=Rhizobium cremeum TaxID=2813827 RepID=UPI0013AEE89C|nr:hypothetical protein [Rhizobium cremeum]MCJ7994026.1 hypothetical protein [Rhizobium cremeum]MCJ7999083.1 hypothetical protein [Rhizobium cremeum]
MMMGSYSLWHWLVAFAFWFLLFGWPIAKILRRAGFSGWWVLLSFVPLANLIGLWVFAVTPWPNVPDQNRPSA